MPEGEVLKCWGVPEASVGGRLRHDSSVGVASAGGVCMAGGVLVGAQVVCWGWRGGTSIVPAAMLISEVFVCYKGGVA